MNIKNLTINKLYPWIIFIVGILIFSLSIQNEFHADYTARFAVFVKSMFYHGPHAFNFLYNLPYPDYPAATTFISYLCSLILGTISMFSIILPNIIVASLTLVFVYLIGGIHSRKLGIYGVIFSLFTIEFYGYGGNLSSDMYITLLTTVSFYIVYTANLYCYKKRLYLIPIMLILSFMCRGPIGLIIPCGVLFGFYLLNKDYKSLLLLSIGAIIILIMCSSALLGAAYLEGGRTFVRQVISMQAASRFSTINLSHLSYIYPIFKRYLISLPLAIITITLLIKINYLKKNPRAQETNLLLYLIMWAAIVFIGLAIVTLQKPRYFLPIVPALSLISGYLFIIKSNDAWITKIKSIFTRIYSLLPYLGLIAILSLLLLKNTPKIATNFMNQVQAVNLPIAFYKIGPDKFDLVLMANAKYYSIPQFIYSEKQLTSNTIIITYKKYLPVIKNHIKIIAKTDIKHHQIIAFTIDQKLLI
jgi:4-amino-4-deoxy-L-arabinose transferase-like glycosyltransferase